MSEANERKLDPAVKRARAEQIVREFENAQTIKDVRAIWERHYLVVGHRLLGRLLIGRDIEEAVT